MKLFMLYRKHVVFFTLFLFSAFCSYLFSQETITLNGNAIYTYESFSIEKDQTLEILQKDNQESCIIIVTGTLPSKIAGNIKTDGNFILMNSHGIEVEGTIFSQGNLLLYSKGLDSGANFQERIFIRGFLESKTKNISLVAREIYLDGFLRTLQGSIELASELETSSQLNSSIFELLPPNNAINQEKPSKIEISGSLFANHQELEKGGEIFLKSDCIYLKNSALLDVSSKHGEGKIFLKSTPSQKENKMEIEKNASLLADALERGNGGNILLYGEKVSCLGFLSARGGSFEGNGGFVEVSGKSVAFQGNVDTLAPCGNTGNFLLDPTDITISNAATSGGSFFEGEFSGTGSTANWNIAECIANLLTTNVTVSTNSDGPSAGNISILDPLIYSSSNYFKLIADQHIQILSTVVNQGSGEIILESQGNVEIGDPTGTLTDPVQLSSDLGNISLTINGDLIVRGGSALNAYAQIGSRENTVNSSITSTSILGSVVIQGGSGEGSYALIGHGGLNIQGGTKRGDVIFSHVGGNVFINGGSGDNAFGQIGIARGFSSSIDANGLVEIFFIDGNFVITGGSGENAYALFGHGGVGSLDEDTYVGDVRIKSCNNGTLQGGTNSNTFAEIGITNGRFSSTGTVNVQSNEISLLCREQLNIISGDGAMSHASIGAFFDTDSTSTNIDVSIILITSWEDCTIETSSVSSTSFVQFGTFSNLGLASSEMHFLHETNLDIEVNNSTVFISTGSNQVDESKTLKFVTKQAVTFHIEAAGDLILHSIADLHWNGYGGTIDIHTNNNGSVEIDSEFGVYIFAGGGIAFVGNAGGGSTSLELRRSDLLIQTNGIFTLGPNAFIQHLNVEEGGIEIIASTITTSASSGNNSFIHNLGSGDMQLTTDEDITILSSIQNPGTGSFTITAGRDLNIGNSSATFQSIIGTSQGTFFVNVGRDINVIAGNATNAFAHLGAMDTFIVGDMYIQAGGDINIIADTALNTYAQIGHRSPNTILGFTFLDGFNGTLTTTPGPNPDTYAIFGDMIDDVIP